MASRVTTSRLVEHLAEAEQLLVERSGGNGGSGNNSVVASEERDSVVEGAAILEDLERSNTGNGDAKSEAGSDGSRLQRRGLAGAEDSPAGSSSAVTDSLSGSMSGAARFRADDEDHVQPAMQSLSMWQRLKETQEAKRVVEERLTQAQEAIESMREMQDRELMELKKQIDSSQASAAKDLLIQRKQLSGEQMVLERQLQMSQELVESAGDENAVMLRTMKALQKSHAEEVANLKNRLEPSQDHDREASLSHQLDASRAEQREMANELTELQLKMLSSDRLRHSEVGDLKMMLDSASYKLEMCEHAGSASSSSGRLLSKQAVARRTRAQPKKAAGAAGKPALDVIEESSTHGDDLDAASLPDSASGFNVSSDAEGEEVVGDMRDFDEDELVDLVIKENVQSKRDIKNLEASAAEQKQVALKLAANVAAREADYESKIKRLMEQLDVSRKVHDLSPEELEVLRELTQGAHGSDEGGALPGLAELTDMLETSQAKKQVSREKAARADPSQAREAEIQELKEQVNALKETNRIAEARVEDLKRALVADERKHKKEIEELKQRVQSSKGNSASRDEFEGLRSRLKSAEEDKNVLVNTFECKEQQWKTKIENLQLELEEMRRERDSETSRYESNIAQLEASAREAMEERRPEEFKPDTAALREPVPAFSWLRCPMRAADSDAGFRPAHCQESCWNVVNAISGCVALWCRLPECSIELASRQANRIWSSSMLKGKSFLSLASAPSSEAWLKKAVQSHQRIASMDQKGEKGPPGFIVRDLGCEAFRNKSGESFDCTVITAHFPEERVCGKPPSILVILEPQTRERGGSYGRPPGPPAGGHSGRSGSSAGPRGGQGQGGRLGSSMSEGSTVSVSPSDSASNVLGFRGQ